MEQLFKKLSSVCEIKNGYAFKSNQYKDEGTPLLRISNFDNGDVFMNVKQIFVDSSFLKTKNNFIVEKGDVLIALSGATTGKYGIYNFDYPSLLNQRIGLIKSDQSDKLDSRYFFYYLHVLKVKILQNAGGAAQPNISTNKISDFEIRLPPLKTQQRIAGILDDAAALRDKTTQLLIEYDLLAQSIFLEMFGDPVINEKGWEFKKLVDVSEKITDGTHHSPKLVDNGFPYVTAKHIKIMSLEFEAKPTFVNQKAHDEIYSRCKPEYDDVFLIKDGATTGVACLNSFKTPISLLSSVGLIKPNRETINSTFLVFWFNHKGVKEQLIRKYMSGAAIRRYTISKMKKFEVIIPPIKLQNEFADKIALIEQQKALAKQELQESEDLFNCLLQQAFKGEL